jgi:hypothetical protein
MPDPPVIIAIRLSRASSTEPTVAKTIWTDADFDAMSWHDNAVHAVAFEPQPSDPRRLLLDIDYIVEWVPPGSRPPL